ncbi:MAG: copper-binding protein [Alphaproteobacteria bacterium]|nr:copper-binding protein [Alphaproteobacteria bacterium]
MKTPIFAATLAVCLIAMGLSSPIRADEGHGHHPSFGTPGKAADVKRTVTVITRDNSYSHEAITVKAGETVKFVIRNEGSLLHEFNIGSPDAHAAHQKEMMQMMEMGMLTPTGIDAEKMKMDHSAMGMKPMKHDDPNSVLVEPGKTRELIWKFTKPMKLEFACNVPGHYQSGMVGEFRFGK